MQHMDVMVGRVTGRCDRIGHNGYFNRGVRYLMESLDIGANHICPNSMD